MNVKQVLRWFEFCSALKLNFLKNSLIRVNISNKNTTVINGHIGCIFDCLPFKYLGLPLRASPN